jgi:hypothetical protein
MLAGVRFVEGRRTQWNSDVNAVLGTLFDQDAVGDVGTTGRMVSAVLTGLGEEISGSFGDTKNLNTFLVGLNSMDAAITKSKLSTEQQGEAFKVFAQGAFKDVKDIGGLTKESSGSFAKMFGNIKNQDGITAFFTELGVEEGAAKQITDELGVAYGNLKNATPLQEFELFNTILQNKSDECILRSQNAVNLLYISG